MTTQVPRGAIPIKPMGGPWRKSRTASATCARQINIAPHKPAWHSPPPFRRLPPRIRPTFDPRHFKQAAGLHEEVCLDRYTQFWLRRAKPSKITAAEINLLRRRSQA